jgi:glycosyltransferase involved in cell wall biosynthesis
MKINPLVSVVINNYNYEHFLSEAIDSALNQTYGNTEVIVVDDGSTDNSRKIIASYGDKITPVLKPNGGQASAFNAGFAVSRGNIICFLDSDDMMMPEKVAEVVEVFGNRKDLGWCFHPLKFMNIKVGEINSKTFITESSQKGLLREYDLREQTKSGNLYKNFPYTSTSGLCFTRPLLQQILPMPDNAEGTLLNESYIILTSLGLSQGVVLDKKLGIYRIHDDNANAILQGKEYQQRTAKIYILQGYWIGVKFPAFFQLANHLIATGIGIYARNGGSEGNYQELVKSHLSSVTRLQRLKIYIRAIYNYIKNPESGRVRGR